MKPNITIKRQVGDDIDSVELFIYNHGYVIHRHKITKDKKKAELFGILRKFWDSYYCMQEIMLMEDEIVTLLNEVKKNK